MQAENAGLKLRLAQLNDQLATEASKARADTEASTQQVQPDFHCVFAA